MDQQQFMEELRGIRRVVINDCYGGFGLSEEAFERYKQLASITDPVFLYYDINRDDPYLIKIVKEMGDSVNGPCANLKIVEIPADVAWLIQDYDGIEWVAEEHRTWR
jgi:hypothetical protein